MTLARRLLASSLLLVAVSAAGAGVYLARFLNAPIVLPTAPPVDASKLFDTTPTTVRMTVEWQKVVATAPLWDFLHDQTIWRRMQFEDWDVLPHNAREQGLQHLLARYGSLATDRRAWRTMTTEQWDQVPQPARVMAFAGMVEYWVRYYEVGSDFELDPELVANTVKAVTMSESWFEHRAVHVNSDGSVDIGLGGASDFARRTIRRWYADGRCDFTMSDDDYYNPWLASRWIAFWFEEMLQEADGDLGLAIRAYNRGIGDARSGEGEDYLAAVRRRRHRYFVGPSESATWAALSAYKRHQTGAIRTDDRHRHPPSSPPHLEGSPDGEHGHHPDDSLGDAPQQQMRVAVRPEATWRRTCTFKAPNRNRGFTIARLVVSRLSAGSISAPDAYLKHLQLAYHVLTHALIIKLSFDVWSGYDAA